MNPDFSLWIAALETDFHPLSAYRLWAERAISAPKTPDLWLLDLFLAETKIEALAALHSGSVAMEPRYRFGFLYLRFERDSGDIGNLLLSAGQYADSCDCGVGCETFYLLLNEWEGRVATRREEQRLSSRVAEAFSPFVELVRANLSQLP
jgi:hypothetical protein